MAYSFSFIAKSFDSKNLHIAVTQKLHKYVRWHDTTQYVPLVNSVATPTYKM